MIIVGILLLVCAVIAVLLQDILALWVCFILGIFCIYSGTKKKQPKKQVSDIVVKPKPPAMTFKAAGVTFGCMFDDKFKDRQSVLKNTYDSDLVLLEEYVFKGEPAFALINRRLETDFGNVPHDFVYQVKEMTQKYDCLGTIEKIDYFVPDDDETGTKIVYYCIVKLSWYEKSTS